MQEENPHQNHPYYYYPIIPLHHHHNMPPRPYPIIQPNPFLWTYCTPNSMYAPYVVPHHLHISCLDYLYRPPSILPSSMVQNLLPPEELPYYSNIIDEQRSISSNQSSNLMK